MGNLGESSCCGSTGRLEVHLNNAWQGFLGERRSKSRLGSLQPMNSAFPARSTSIDKQARLVRVNLDLTAHQLSTEATPPSAMSR